MQTRILEKFSSIPAGTVFFAAALTEDPSIDADALRSALQEAVRDGSLLRVARGLYCKPRRTTAGVVLPPDQDSVIEAIIRHYDVDAVPIGLSAAWRLGLITERPNPFLLASSSGQYKVAFNGWKVEFLPGRTTPFRYKTELAALLLTALPAIGEQNLTPGQAATLKRLVVKCPDRTAFREDVSRLPLWMKNYLRRL